MKLFCKVFSVGRNFASLSFRENIKQTNINNKVLSYIDKLQVGRRRRLRLIPRTVGPWETLIDCGTKGIAYVFALKFKHIATVEYGKKLPKEVTKSLNPQVAFIGRSNVGKSSLLKTLSIRGAQHLRVQNKPGTTININLYDLGNCITLVDMPGYGFSFAQEEEKKRMEFLNMSYLCGAKSLKRVIVLIDARLGIKDIDRDMFEQLEKSNIPYQIVITKTDLVGRKTLAKRVTLIKNELGEYRRALNTVLMVSARNTAGVGELCKELGHLIDATKLNEIVGNFKENIYEDTTKKEKIDAIREPSSRVLRFVDTPLQRKKQKEYQIKMQEHEEKIYLSNKKEKKHTIATYQKNDNHGYADEIAKPVRTTRRRRAPRMTKRFKLKRMEERKKERATLTRKPGKYKQGTVF